MTALTGILCAMLQLCEFKTNLYTREKLSPLKYLQEQLSCFELYEMVTKKRLRPCKSLQKNWRKYVLLCARRSVQRTSSEVQ